MAVDTAEKRFSMMAMASGGDGTFINMMFEVDGSVDLDDRQHLFDCYSGIAFEAAVAGQSVPGSRHRRRSRSRTIYR